MKVTDGWAEANGQELFNDFEVVLDLLLENGKNASLALELRKKWVERVEGWNK